MDFAAHYARRLLAELNRDATAHGSAAHPALAWRRAGLMAVTGSPDGPGLVCPAALAAAADGALMALKTLAPGAALPAHGALLLGERARLMGLARGGRVSANGFCRLLDLADGRIALNLARADDWDLIPALLEGEDAPDWPSLEAALRTRPMAEILGRAVELGFAVAEESPPPPFSPVLPPLPPGPARTKPPLVVELAPLWAGPLAGSLLAMAGAYVVKLESLTRPDGARGGNPDFYHLLNGGKRSVALDFAAPEGRAALARLLARADIVIEGSRPRALRQMGIDRDAFIGNGTIWVSITAHADDTRVGFGDDAAIAAGLATIMAQGWGAPLFAGDAIADPLTGLHAALGALASWQSGGGRLLRVSLSGSFAHALSAGMATGAALRDWQALAEADTAPLSPLREISTPARPLGADTDEVLSLC